MAGNPTQPDDLEAVRSVVEALKALPADDQRRVLRWAQEKLGLIGPSTQLPSPPGQQASHLPPGEAAEPSSPPRTGDIRAFLGQKRPVSDVQFAAAVAYFFAFEASPGDRRQEIGAADLQEASRLAGRARLKTPIVTLHNAAKRGYLDKARTRGKFKLNSVGENLVAMAMPSGDVDATSGRRAAKRAARRKR